MSNFKQDATQLSLIGGQRKHLSSDPLCNTDAFALVDPKSGRCQGNRGATICQRELFLKQANFR